MLRIEGEQTHELRSERHHDHEIQDMRELDRRQGEQQRDFVPDAVHLQPQATAAAASRPGAAGIGADIGRRSRVRVEAAGDAP